MTKSPSPAQKMTTSRRGLVRFATVSGLAGAATLATAPLLASPAQAAVADVFSHFKYPAVTGPSLALWGSSSFAGAYAEQGVSSGVDSSLDALLAGYLSAPVLEFGRGGEVSSQIAARRGHGAYRYKLVFPNDRIPASGSVSVTLQAGSKVAWNESAQAPGFVGSVPGLLAAGKTAGSYTFTRLDEGSEVYAPAGTAASWFYSYQEMISRSSYHVLQLGRNNLDQLSALQEDTRACFEMAPERSIVMGHFRAQGSTPDSAQGKQVDAYNAWAAQEYGNLFVNPETWLRERSQESWLRYGALAGSGVWSSDEDRTAYDEGKLPPSLFASDGFHLNAWGYVTLAQMIHAKVKELGWF